MLAAGMKAELGGAHDGEPMEGRSSPSTRRSTRRTRTFLVKVAVPNPGLRLQAGLFATARFECHRGWARSRPLPSQ